MYANKMKMCQNDPSHQDVFRSETSIIAGVQPVKTSKASPPFNDGGDVILRTADNVDFRVITATLRLASPLFNDMFSLPQPIDHDNKEDTSAKIPVIPVIETSATLDTLLRLCYPIDRPDLKEQETSMIGEVLRAGLKYDISVIVKAAREAFKERLVRSERDAFVAYAIACSLKLEEEARAAAIACLRWPAHHTTVPEINLMSSWDYHNLLDFHRRAIEAVTNLFGQRSFLSNDCSGLSDSYHRCSSHVQYMALSDGSGANVHHWWIETMKELKIALGVAPLDTSKLSLPFVAAKIKSSCFDCAVKLCKGWDQSREKLLSDINQEVGKIELKLS